MFELDGVACQGLPFFYPYSAGVPESFPAFFRNVCRYARGEAEAGTQGMNRDLFDGASARKFSREEALRVIHNAVQPVAASFGLDVWGIELAGAGRPVVRIFVDAPASALPSEACSPEENDAPGVQGGVGVEQCAEISRMVGLALDVEDVFPDAWTLEVSSPGMDRPFFKASQLLPYVGRELDVTRWNPHPAYAPRKKFRGTLVRAGGDDFTLHVDDMPPPLCEADIDMTWDSVRRARLVPVFPDTSKPGKKAAPGVPRGTAAKKSAGGGKKHES